jgi:hypothetical protein
MRFPPVELDDALGRDAERLEVRADPERGHDGHIHTPQQAHGGEIEMIIVIVGYQHRVEAGQITHGHGDRLESLGSREARG